MNFGEALALICLLMPGNLGVVSEKRESAAAYCSQGQTFLAKGKYRDAREAAQRALGIDSQSAEAEALLGTAEFGLGELDAAQKHLQRALALQPGLIAARQTLGTTYLRQRRLEEARRQFESILASDPQDFVSLYSLGLAYLMDDHSAEALKHFEKASKLRPSDPALLTGMLQARLRLKQEDGAEAALAELDAKLDERDPRRVQLAALLANEGAYNLAIQEFERLRRIQPESTEISYNLALAYHRVGKEAEAAALLEALLARKEDAELQDLLGEVEQNRGNHHQALTSFRRAAELDPRNEDYRFDYAEALAQGWALDEAAEVFSAATKDFPESARMWLGLGAVSYLAGRYAESARTLLHAADIAPHAPEAYFLLGRAYDAAGSLQDAITERFARYVKTKPKDALAECLYGKILAARSRQFSPGGECKGRARLQSLIEAQRHLRRAIALDGKLAEAHLELGAIFDSRGEFKEAQTELARAVQLDPKSSTAYYQLAQVYRKLGEPAQAQKAAAIFEQLKAQQRADLDREQVESFLKRVKR